MLLVVQGLNYRAIYPSLQFLWLTEPAANAAQLFAIIFYPFEAGLLSQIPASNDKK